MTCLLQTSAPIGGVQHLCAHFGFQHAHVGFVAAALHVKALKTQLMKGAAEAGKMPAPHLEDVLIHRSRIICCRL